MSGARNSIIVLHKRETQFVAVEMRQPVAEDPKARRLPSETSDAAKQGPEKKDDTLTSDMMPIDDQSDVPFSLPHVSELEITPRDASKDTSQGITMPAFGSISPVEHAAPTLIGEAGQLPLASVSAQNQEAQARQCETHAASQMNRGQAFADPRLADSHPPPTNIAKSTPLTRKPSRRRRLLGLPLGCIWVLVGSFFTFCGGLTLLTTVAAVAFFPQVEAEWAAKVAQVDEYRGFESSFIYDRYGNELYESFGEGRRVRVSYDRIPTSLIRATIAIEDDSFFENIGIDVGHTAVAALSYLGAGGGGNTPGGSTITQQLVRNVLFDYEKRAQRSIARKAEEIVLAIVLTQAKSKEDILELYFNEIYYGNLAYGVQTAAQTFFGKDVEGLTLGEAAMLAGLPQAPASLDPLNPDPAVQAAVEARWRQVLGEMVEEGFITGDQAKAALSEGLTFVPANTSLTAPHFTVYAQGELERLLTGLGYSPEDIARGGLRVYTTLDQNVNRLAQQAAASHVAQLWNKNVSNGAVVVSKPLTGEIIAMVGSIDYDNVAIDGSVNVTTAFRQPGSTMKPFTYSASIERGMSTADVLWDTRTKISIPGLPVYTPRNFDNAFHGPMTMRTALANSYNIPAVQTLRHIGVDYLLGLLRRFGITTLSDDASQYGLSLTLGGGEITLIELTNAFAVFANQGNYVPVTSILCVVSSDDVILYQYDNSCPEGHMNEETVDRAAAGTQVLDPRVSFVISDILADNQARSTAMGAYSPLRTDNIFASVKTGTTDDVKDNWTIGYTRNVAVGVWVGNNNGEPMVDSSGLTGAAPIWNAVLTGIYNNNKLLTAFADEGQLLYDQATPPPGLSLRQICDVRRLTDPATRCPATVNEWFLDGPAAVPDADGILRYPQQARQRTPVPVQGSVLHEVSPGIYQTLAYPLPPEFASTIQFRVAPGEKQPLPPSYCRVPVQDAQEAISAGAQNLLFIRGPSTTADDVVEAERFAREANLAFLPTIDCMPGVYSLQSIGNVGASLDIQQPANGQSVSGILPIIGTALFDGSQAEYYHLFIRGGQFADWTPLGQKHQQAVSNGQLEILHGDALQAGSYILRLALIRGGHIVQENDVIFVVP